jgi:hypothetical protein
MLSNAASKTRTNKAGEGEIRMEVKAAGSRLAPRVVDAL